MKRIIRIALLASCTTIAIAYAKEFPPPDVQFVTSIQCKTFSARLISTCASTREKFGPPICTSQVIQSKSRDVIKSTTLFNGHPIRLHAFNWQCFFSKGAVELLALGISDIENIQNEDVWLFKHNGERLSKKAESKIFHSPTWLKSKVEDNLTGQGTVSLPEINE